jgi:hypothetical protein
MAESRIWRRRLKSVLPGALEVVRVILPFITMCPLAEIIRRCLPRITYTSTISVPSIEPMATMRSFFRERASTVRALEHRPVKNPYGIPEIDAMFYEVRLPLTLVPLEKHLHALADGRS